MERFAFQEAVDFIENSQSHRVSHEFQVKTGTEKDVQGRYWGEKHQYTEKKWNIWSFVHAHGLPGWTNDALEKGIHLHTPSDFDFIIFPLRKISFQQRNTWCCIFFLMFIYLFI